MDDRPEDTASRLQASRTTASVAIRAQNGSTSSRKGSRESALCVPKFRRVSSSADRENKKIVNAFANGSWYAGVHGRSTPRAYLVLARPSVR